MCLRFRSLEFSGKPRILNWRNNHEIDSKSKKKNQEPLKMQDIEIQTSKGSKFTNKALPN